MITYTDKVQNQVNPLPIVNQWRAVDANEVKAQVNNLYSTLTLGFVALVDGATVTWDTESKILPEAKLTCATVAVTLDMLNVLDGSHGTFKLITATASAITITFDSSFTNKKLGSIGEETFTTYTFPAATAKEYILTYVCDGTTLHWTIGDIDWVTWTPTITGITGGTFVARYFLINKMLHFYITAVVNGTGSGTGASSRTFTLPSGMVTPNSVVMSVPRIVNNGVNATVPGLAVTAIGSNVVIVFRDGSLTATWTGAGACGFSLVGMVEIS